MRQLGYTVITSIVGKQVESDLYVCGHCQYAVMVAPGQMPEDAGGLCKQCNRLICKSCYGKMGCDVFERKLERAESKAAIRRSIEECCR